MLTIPLILLIVCMVGLAFMQHNFSRRNEEQIEELRELKEEVLDLLNDMIARDAHAVEELAENKRYLTAWARLARNYVDQFGALLMAARGEAGKIVVKDSN